MNRCPGCDKEYTVAGYIPQTEMGCRRAPEGGHEKSWCAFYEMHVSDPVPHIQQELELLRKLWYFLWNEKGDADNGHAIECSYKDADKETKLCEDVDDFYVEWGYPTIEVEK